MDSRSSGQSSGRRRSQKPQFAPSGAPLQLPPLPRFHPATYGSNMSSLSATPTSSGNSPQPTMSARAEQLRQLSDAQRQLYVYQREFMNQMSNGSYARSSSASSKPDAPKLTPLAGSPGPVTPLELEGDEYLSAGLSHSGTLDLEELLKEEARRTRDSSPRRLQSSNTGSR